MYTIQENIIIKESPGPVAGNPAIVSPVKIRLKLPSPLASRHCTPERKIEPSPFFAPENNEIRPLGGPAAPRTPTSIVHRHQPSTTGKSKKANIIHLITKKRTLIQSCPSPIPRKITLKDPHTISEIVTNPISKPFKKRKLPRLAKKSFTPKAANDADSTRLHRYDEHHQPFEFEANLNTKERAEFMTRWALSSGHLDKYHITLLLGWGGCGAVLGGYRKSDRKETASMAVTGSGAAVEIEILSSVSHINIIQYLESFDDDKVFYLVMEKFGTPWGGETLSDTLLVRHDLGSATLPDSTLLTVTNGSCATLFDFIDLFGYVPLHLHKVIFSQVASAVAHLHNQQIIHGDIKEENILLQSIGNGSYSVRLCDFGHARRIKRSQPGMKFYGTRDISPPELLTYMHECENGLDISANSCVSGYAQDIWALGMVLYTVIHGCLPANQEAYLNNQLDLSRQEFLPAAYDENIRRGSNVLTIDCLDILQKMLWIDPKKRITISQIMLHPWMNP